VASNKLSAHLHRMSVPHLKLVPDNTSIAKPGFVQPTVSKMSIRDVRKIGHKLNGNIPRYRKAG
jgi:hypothetical protein